MDQAIADRLDRLAEAMNASVPEGAATNERADALRAAVLAGLTLLEAKYQTAPQVSPEAPAAAPKANKRP